VTVSLLRTIAIGEPATAYGVPVRLPLLRWPLAEPEDVLDYSIDVSLLLADVADTIVAAEAAVAPSGSGELAGSNLSVAGGVITLWLAGGVPGRDYVIQVSCVTAAQRGFGFRIALAVDNALAAEPGPPPSPGFGAPLLWGRALPVIALEDGTGAVLLENDAGYLLQG
jgi:hypothetical protein